MKSEELHLLIKEGEGLSVEFKEKYTPEIDRDMEAFSNTKGGYIFLGVCDDGKIVGEALTNKLKAEIVDLARNCEPNIHLKRITQIDKVVLVEIAEGEEKPYSCSSGYFRRLDAVTQKMPHKEVRLLFRESDPVSFESLVCPNQDIKGVSLARVKTFLKETGTALKATKANLPMVLSSLGVADKNKINNAGALMFAARLGDFIPHSETIMGAFKGTDKTRIYDRKDIQDDLFTQFNEAVAFLLKHLNVRSEIWGVNRHDIYEIPLDALREAVVNAIVHRDYAFKGTSIYISVFDDRVEIENPGSLPSGMTVRSLGKSSVRRNPIIADLFHRLGKVERMGSGIDRMRNLMREASLKKPAFEAGDFFRVTFYRDPRYSLKQTGGTVEKTVAITVEKTVVKILTLIKENPQITQKKLMKATGLTRRGVEWNLKKMKDEGLIRRVGALRSGHWELVGKKRAD